MILQTTTTINNLLPLHLLPLPSKKFTIWKIINDTISLRLKGGLHLYPMIEWHLGLDAGFHINKLIKGIHSRQEYIRDLSLYNKKIIDLWKLHHKLTTAYVKNLMNSQLLNLLQDLKNKLNGLGLVSNTKNALLRIETEIKHLQVETNNNVFYVLQSQWYHLTKTTWEFKGVYCVDPNNNFSANFSTHLDCLRMYDQFLDTGYGNDQSINFSFNINPVDPKKYYWSVSLHAVPQSFIFMAWKKHSFLLQKLSKIQELSMEVESYQHSFSSSVEIDLVMKNNIISYMGIFQTIKVNTMLSSNKFLNNFFRLIKDYQELLNNIINLMEQSEQLLSHLNIYNNTGLELRAIPMDFLDHIQGFLQSVG